MRALLLASLLCAAACAADDGAGQDLELGNSSGKADGSEDLHLALRRDMSWVRLRATCSAWFWCTVDVKAIPDDASLVKAGKYFFDHHPESNEVRLKLYTISLESGDETQVADRANAGDVYFHARREPDGQVTILKDDGEAVAPVRWGRWSFEVGPRDRFAVWVKLADDGVLSEFNFGDDDRVDLAFSASWD